jgi:hypothetical protein
MGEVEMGLMNNVKSNITPVTDKEGLQKQVDAQVKVLYSQDVSVAEKEVAALNYRKLVNHYHTLFHGESPAETVL